MSKIRFMQEIEDAQSYSGVLCGSAEETHDPLPSDEVWEHGWQSDGDSIFIAAIPMPPFICSLHAEACAIDAELLLNKSIDRRAYEVRRETIRLLYAKWLKQELMDRTPLRRHLNAVHFIFGVGAHWRVVFYEVAPAPIKLQKKI